MARFALGIGITIAAAWMPWGAASESCLGCHTFEEHDRATTGMHGRLAGCTGCHGASTDHQQRPTVAEPDVSYGPRWSASAGQQDQQCLACHGLKVAKHWDDALHMANGLTCVACHDMHATNDKALNPHTQADVCTVCHTAQKEGIHGIAELRDDNRKLVERLKSMKQLAEDANDNATDGLLDDWTDMAEERVWFLNSLHAG